jgi:uncharacterized protein YaaQ
MRELQDEHYRLTELVAVVAGRIATANTDTVIGLQAKQTDINHLRNIYEMIADIDLLFLEH